ncbi:hypothetical protein GV64_08440 [Endozoicomonas elysicola]|uniref:VanZ-like domain-containing protein n=1 Tax=Endozoicomonas elysicola TaxID=305900 RepID=A0A081K9E3_9GAMM|nr:hypothetical protein GV64_08440 [Endozoicomonas elysicola]
MFVAILLLCTVMALIPGAMDPTGFLNDKFKHAVTFFSLALMLDCLAFPTARFVVLKPLGLFMFGILLEVLQNHVGYRQGNTGDLTDILSNLIGISGYFLMAAVVRYFLRPDPEALPGTGEV